MSGPASIFLISIGASRDDGDLVLLGVVFLVAALFGVALFFWSRRFEIKDPRPLPVVVRWSFVVFVVALIINGIFMVFHLVDVMPWAVTDDGEVLYGLMFLGAASYFVYGLVRPSWQNAAGQLVAFLVYDLVLIVPFIQHFSKVAPRLRDNLAGYTAVISVSALLAIYYLFINPATRLWGRPAQTEAPASARA
jgi:hypothetical protein